MGNLRPSMENLAKVEHNNRKALRRVRACRSDDLLTHSLHLRLCIGCFLVRHDAGRAAINIPAARARHDAPKIAGDTCIISERSLQLIGLNSAVERVKDFGMNSNFQRRARRMNGKALREPRGQ